MQLTIGSVFSGIEGIGLGFLRTGCFRILWQIEKDDYCQRILRQRFRDTALYEDVRTCYGDGGESRAFRLSPVDVLTGGFPCQDISTSGRQEGIDQGKESGLWREQLRLIRELRPRYVLVENVAALRSASKRCKGGIRPAGLGRVLGDLAEIGYDAEWHCLPVSALGAPHRRDRIFVLGYRDGLRWNNRGNHWRERSLCRDEEWNAAPTRADGQQLFSQSRTHGQVLVDSDPERLEGAELLGWKHDLGARSLDTDSHKCTWGGYDGLADAYGTRLEEWAVVRGNEDAQCASTCGGGTDSGETAFDSSFESCMVRDAAWFSTQLDTIGRTYSWPARPNEDQYAWEPPRVVTGHVPERKNRVRALGNSVSPAAAEAMANLLLLRHMQQGGRL